MRAPNSQLSTLSLQLSVSPRSGATGAFDRDDIDQEVWVVALAGGRRSRRQITADLLRRVFHVSHGVVRGRRFPPAQSLTVPSPVEAIIRRDLAEHCLAALPPRARRIATCRFWRGESYPQIAARLGRCSPAAIAQSWSTAARRIRARFQGEFA